MNFVLDCTILNIMLITENTIETSHLKIMTAPISVSFTYSSTRRHMPADESKTMPLPAPRMLLGALVCLKT